MLHRQSYYPFLSLIIRARGWSYFVKNLNDYHKLIAGVLQPPSKSRVLNNQRSIWWAVCVAALLPVAAFLVINYPLQAAFVFLLAASLMVIGREQHG
jgi:hypothetical protein